ncbi:hypothetical protein [Rhizobium laguerreae]|uniref:hypothetical protein n=1 Tax=Rhizobium laguerreae TaxID=1076926 RepID=UPI001C910B82|nr:hypothetical protein [Rhizobium laguerreae]MBY3483285.1 hypothetical protein [Rhizobium laguerreae]
MLKLTQTNFDNFQRFYIPHVKDCMEVGNVARLRSVIRQFDVFVERTGREDFMLSFAEAKAWLLEAERYEEIHGPRSRFNEDHPLIKSIEQKIAKIQKRNAEAFKSSIASKASVHSDEINAA